MVCVFTWFSEELERILPLIDLVLRAYLAAKGPLAKMVVLEEEVTYSLTQLSREVEEVSYLIQMKVEEGVEDWLIPLLEGEVIYLSGLLMEEVVTY